MISPFRVISIWSWTSGGAASTQLYARRIRGNDPDGLDDYTISYQA